MLGITVEKKGRKQGLHCPRGASEKKTPTPEKGPALFFWEMFKKNYFVLFICVFR
jgi:hypothetical protein